MKIQLQKKMEQPAFQLNARPWQHWIANSFCPLAAQGLFSNVSDTVNWEDLRSEHVLVSSATILAQRLGDKEMLRDVVREVG